jgi:dipeptidyl aminopeptidase/acylaminoacyl peptidase
MQKLVVKKLPLFVLAAGGKLAVWAERDGIARYVFTPKYNPSLQPRLGLGYGVAALNPAKAAAPFNQT